MCKVLDITQSQKDGGTKGVWAGGEGVVQRMSSQPGLVRIVYLTTSRII
jgi:hypothetical protein